MQCLCNSLVYLETEFERVGENSTLFNYLRKTLSLATDIGLILTRSLRVSYSSPKEYRTLLLNVPHVSTLRNPKYLTPTYWRSRCRFHQPRASGQKNAHLLIVDEQLFQPYNCVSVTLYLHFHVVNPILVFTRRNCVKLRFIL